MNKLITGALGALLLSSAAFAAPSLIVTEVMSNAFTGGANSTGLGDWFELTNFSTSSINITGFKMDDNSNLFSASVALNGITSIAAGESVVFIESSAAADATLFKTLWSKPSLQVGLYSGSGVGLSSTSDAVNIFDGAGSLVTGATFGAATTGTSFYYDQGSFTGNSTLLTAISAAGLAGAFTSSNGLIGSPGAIPEPSTYAALAGVGALGLALYRRRGATR
jgi:hypothetical protein